MPQYLFQNESTGEIKEIYQKIDEPHEYAENGVKWARIFTIPNASIDTRIDPFSSQEYIQKTGKSRATYGELLERSKEMSEKRKQKLGHDPIKEKFMAAESKRRGGRRFTDESAPSSIEVDLKL